MAIQFGEIYLNSHNPEKLFNFLSFLLEVQASEYTENRISFNFQSINFVIRPCETKKLSRASYFSLTVTNEQELNDLKRNIEFYYYKESNKKFTVADIEQGLEFTDPDERKWSVFVGKPQIIPKVHQDSIQLM